VNRTTLPATYAGATIATLFALLLPEPAAAHVSVQPRLVEQGAVAELQVELPRLRPGAAPERLEVEGAGIELLSSRLTGTAGSETQWAVRLRVESEPGRVPLRLRPVYPDGRSVEVEDTLTVVPGAESSGFPWLAAAVGTFLAVAVAAVALVVARRQRRA
jgi:hypothetical protein